MSRDYFAILGLTPGRYKPAEITRRFRAARKRLLDELHDPATHGESRRQLDELHIAYTALRDPGRQAEYLERRRDDDLSRLRGLIADSLEGGLLRQSRRLLILEEARRLGISDFHAQLMIAQVQFGDERITPVTAGSARNRSASPSQAAARLAAVGILALALFLAMIRWLGV
jgi:hypothetical protein